MSELLTSRTFRGGGELGERIESHDWSGTLGRIEDWPQSLKTAVQIMLTSRQPIWIGWGPDLTYLYNDPYKTIIGDKHPWALGRPTKDVWREIWKDIGPMLAHAMGGEEGTYVEEQLLIMERSGFREETYYTFSYTPITDEAGKTSGIFCANTDDTQRVVGERQLALLRELATAGSEARTLNEVFGKNARALATNPRDLPFAYVYLAEPDGKTISLVSSTHGSDHPAAPNTVVLDEPSRWPFADVIGEQSICMLERIQERFGPMFPTGGFWTEAPARAVLIPIPARGETGRRGVLVAGLNPFRPFDDGYRGFLTLAAGEIAASLANAQAYEEERRRAEALAELDRAKTLFFSNISHEFRTPLTLMLGPIEEILAKPADRVFADNRALVQVAHRNSLRLLKLVNSLLDFSRIEAGRAHASYAATDLAALTSDLASNFQSACTRAGLHLIVDCPPLAETVFVDREMWEKIVLNLLSNAFKFTLEGEIAVRLRGVHGFAELTVSDTGVGIPEQELPRLFERFHRIEGQRGRSFEGSGIGLALVQELVKLHGGSIRVESFEGHGTTFTITVPFGRTHLPQDRIGGERNVASTAVRARTYVDEAVRWLGGEDTPAEVPAGAEPIQNPPPQLAGARILLADDNADMRVYVRRLLEPYCHVEAVADGQAALEALQTRPVDLVLTDVMMPRLDGFELLRAIRSDPARADVPVVLLSARADEEAKLEGLNTGADDYLVKPFNARELLARIGANLNLAKLRKQAALDLRDTRRVNELALRLLRGNEPFDVSLQAILDAAIEITGADKGNIQLFDPASNTLELIVQRGFEGRFLEFFARVRRDEPLACSAAMQTCGQVVVEDVTQSDIFAGQKSLDVLLEAGIRAVQSTPLLNASGEIIGMISTHFARPHRPSERQLRHVELLGRQVTDYLERRKADEERERARRALQYTSEQLATLVNTAPLGIYLVDAQFRIREVNPTALAVFGDLPGGMTGRDFDDVIHTLWEQEYADEVVSIFRHTLQTGEPYATQRRDEFRIDRDRLEYYEWRVERITLPDGSYGVVCYFRDIADQVRAEETRQLLLLELNHRVKNTLASVQAIAHQTLRNTRDPSEFAARFSGRVQSMARVHALLTESSWKGADLRELIRDQLLQGSVDESRLTAWGPPVQLEPQMAVHIAVMLHELGTNSIKYGALSLAKGWVTVSWTVSGETLNLRWIERGGPTVSAPSRRGFGMTLIEQSARSEGGTAEQLIEPEGLTWIIAMRLPQSATQQAEPVLISRTSPAQQAGALKTPAPCAGLRLLVVEDESLIALDLIDRLEKFGCQSVRAVSTEEGCLKALEEGVFDCALLDANLHGRPVDSIAAALTRRGVPFVFVTGYGRAGLPTAFAQAPVLSKPVTDDQLIEAIKEVTAERTRTTRLDNAARVAHLAT